MIEKIITTSFLTSLILLMFFKPLGIKFNLVDFPTERKNHVGNVPLIGGICIFFGVLIPCLLFEYNKFSFTLLFFASFILIQGVWDDYKNLKASSKLVFQTFIIIIMIYVTDVKIESLGYLFTMSYPIELGILSLPITIIAVVGLTNAFNMIDGYDGLAGISVILAIIGLLSFNLNYQVSPLNDILLAIVAASVPFMLFNIAPYPKMKIFLGDGGSLFLGFVISWALIYCAENDNSFNPSYALWCVAIPLFDFFTVIIIRLFEKRSLIIASKDHIHHVLENEGFSKLQILISISFTGLALLLFGKLIENNFPSLSFPIFIILFLLYLFIRIYNLIKKKSEIN
jgi:UDP-GlcNAc:undecaprenyl-phosphate/decaprenyl-phosphate GlcNAc-1-phosphate transferase